MVVRSSGKSRWWRLASTRIPAVSNSCKGGGVFSDDGQNSNLCPIHARANAQSDLEQYAALVSCSQF